MTVITVIQCMTDTLSMTVIQSMKNMTVVSFMKAVKVMTEHSPSRAVFHKQILKPRQDGQPLFGAAVDNPFPFLPDHPHSRVALTDAFRTC